MRTHRLNTLVILNWLLVQHPIHLSITRREESILLRHPIPALILFKMVRHVNLTQLVHLILVPTLVPILTSSLYRIHDAGVVVERDVEISHILDSTTFLLGRHTLAVSWLRAES